MVGEIKSRLVIYRGELDEPVEDEDGVLPGAELEVLRGVPEFVCHNVPLVEEEFLFEVFNETGSCGFEVAEVEVYEGEHF